MSYQNYAHAAPNPVADLATPNAFAVFAEPNALGVEVDAWLPKMLEPAALFPPENAPPPPKVEVPVPPKAPNPVAGLTAPPKAVDELKAFWAG